MAFRKIDTMNDWFYYFAAVGYGVMELKGDSCLFYSLGRLITLGITLNFLLIAVSSQGLLKSVLPTRKGREIFSFKWNKSS